MPTYSLSIDRLRELPAPRRRRAVRSLVISEVKASVLMEDDEELPTDVAYFDLGLTSLRIAELRDRLQQRLDHEITTTILFNSPTVDDLIARILALVDGACAEQGAEPTQTTLSPAAGAEGCGP